MFILVDFQTRVNMTPHHSDSNWEFLSIYQSIVYYKKFSYLHFFFDSQLFTFYFRFFELLSVVGTSGESITKFSCALLL